MGIRNCFFKLGIVAAAIAAIVFTSRAVLAQAALAQPEPSIDVWSEYPSLTTAMTMNTDPKGQTHFGMAIIFRLTESIGFDKVMALTQNASLLKKYFRYVQDAQFKPLSSAGKSVFTLTVGIFSDHFTQTFNCEDLNLSPTNWKRTCIENAPNANSVLANSKIIVQCIELPGSMSKDPASEAGVQCELDVSGEAHIPKHHFFVDDPTGPKIACGFLNHLTSYWAQLGLIAGHDAPPNKTEDYMSGFEPVMDDLKKQEKALLNHSVPTGRPIVSGWPSAPETIPNFLYNFETVNPSSGS